MTRLSDFKVLTFDCYGTLIDWETGLYAALGPILARMSAPPSRDAALEAFARLESIQEAATPQMIYRELLTQVHRRLCEEWGVAATDDEHDSFGASVPDWPAFADSAESLAYLKQHYRLVILSNVDRRSFAGSNRRLGVEFDAVYTAEDIGSYKPDERNFAYLINHLSPMGLARTDILHTAQSLYHDHVPAKRLGLATAWIDRRHDRGGTGATKPVLDAPKYDFRFTSLAEFAQAHRADRA